MRNKAQEKGIRFIVIPAGGMGPGICEIITSVGQGLLGFLDDDPDKTGKTVYGYPVLGPISDFALYADRQFIIAGFANDKDIGRVRRIRAVIYLPANRFETVIDPSASVSRYAEIGNGCVVASGARIAPGVKIGNHVMIMANAVVEHNSVIGDFCNICGGAVICGYVTIGEACWIGANASITGRLTIGDDCLVGIGAVVIRDVEGNSVVVGNPARFLRKVYE